MPAIQYQAEWAHKLYINFITYHRNNIKQINIQVSVIVSYVCNESERSVLILPERNLI